MTRPLTRCSWPGDSDPLYVRYHDEEWGVPERDGRALWEKLQLDGFQAGLAWITILRKRDNFRRAFDGFEPEAVARYGEADVQRLLADAGIIRSRAKIEGCIKSAQAYLDMQAKGRDFAEFCWSFVGGEPVTNHYDAWKSVPAQSEQSVALSKALKKTGFKFCGPVIVYAWMQATGMVNDHAPDCFRRKAVAAMARNRTSGAT